eukprot:302407_1
MPLDIFKENGNKCFGKKVEVFDIKECDYIYRLIASLKYYTLLNVSHRYHEIFNQFCGDIYKNLLDDWIHLISTHSNSDQLYEIHRQLVEEHNFSDCIIEYCSLIAAHYFVTKCNDTKYAFYANLMGQLHFYLFHLFDFGLRINYKTLNETITEESDQQNEFCKMRDIIFSSRKNTASFTSRFTQENNKYNISINQKPQKIMEISTTFMDQISMNTKRYMLLSDKVNSLQLFLHEEEYDSDAFRYDMEQKHSSNVSNMLQILQEEKLISLFQKHCTNFKLATCSFSTGLIFFYWPYYKKIAEGTPQNRSNDMFWNIFDYGGYEISQLYVCKKYDTFKQEILTHIDKDLSTSSILKAQKFIDTQRAKMIKSTRKDDMHYEITYGTSISIQHLLSLVLYCDISELCTAFSATFRHIEPFEPLGNIKKRNSEHWWLSKFLKELVQYFGHDATIQRGAEHGPFYCGISAVLYLPAFSIRLCSPTSTSKHVQVAINFAKRAGMILELN